MHIINSIPLGRGLGSSGSAVVAGLDCRPSRQSQEHCLLDYAVEGAFRVYSLGSFYASIIGGHPDDVAPSSFGRM
jgi:homoserine kinase